MWTRRQPAILRPAHAKPTNLCNALATINQRSTVKGIPNMKTETQVQPNKKLALAKTTIRVLAQSQDQKPIVPTEGCTGSCGG